MHQEDMDNAILGHILFWIQKAKKKEKKKRGKNVETVPGLIHS